jgi:hypothetical protein
MRFSPFFRFNECDRDFAPTKQLYLALRDQFVLREIIDAVTALLQDGFIEVRYTNDGRSLL